MHKKQKKIKFSQNNSPAEALKKFRRTLHSGRDLKFGLSKARAEAEICHLPSIVKTLAKPPYVGVLVGAPFPKTYSDFKTRKRLRRVALEKEFIWCASILSLYCKELSIFAKLRSEFDITFIKGDLEQAEEILNVIEAELGVSIWLIANKLRLLQMKHGLAAQKDYLEQIINIDGLNAFAAYMAYFFSLRNEENVSLAALESEVSDLIEIPEVGDYALYHIIPSALTRIRDIAAPIAWEESQPIIDRFEAFVAMSQLGFARYGVENSLYICQALDLIRDVNDVRVGRMLAITVDDPLTLLRENSTIGAFDAYTEGRYLEACTSSLELLELKARAKLLMDNAGLDEVDSSLASEITSSIRDFLLVSAEYPRATQRLKKLAIICAHQSVSIQITALLERTHEHIFVHSYSEIDRLAAICGPVDNPWNCNLLGTISGNNKYLDKLMEHYKISSSLCVRKLLGDDNVDASKSFTDLNLPDYRLAMYRGHYAFQHDQYSQASKFYREAINSNYQYISLRASAYLFKSLFADDLVPECLTLVVDHTLSNPYAYRLYPIEELAEAALKVDTLREELALAILLHTAARNIHSKWERELSDIYENVMFKLNASHPTELFHNIETLGRDRLVYFLRFVCVPRILDDTTSFETVADIENERIAICQLLIELDPSNSSTYSTEIKVITRDANVAHLLQQVEASKIYVDEDGIRNALEETMRDGFNRYQHLLNLPSIDYQADKISKRFEQLLSNPDLKNLKLPSSEREGLFTTMLNDFVTQFALNPAFGLDTHLSTTIRHGAFEGHIRGPLAVQDLLCPKVADAYILPERWEKHFHNLDLQELKYITKQMGRFTLKVEEIIERYRKELLHIRGSDANLSGMFNFIFQRETVLELMDSVTIRTTYEDFIEQLMSYCWIITDRSMELIRLELGESLVQINQAFHALITSVESKIPREHVSAFSDAVARARTDFQAAIESISGWFRRSVDPRRDPFDFDIALEVALQQIRNCYVKSRLFPQKQLNVRTKIAGQYLDGMVEVLFILLQNIILHSSCEGSPNGVVITAHQNGTVLDVSVVNKLDRNVDLDACKQIANEAMSRYEHDTAMKMARREGGSGLSKVWRILEFDLKKDHSLTLEVCDDYTFCAHLTISDICAEL